MGSRIKRVTMDAMSARYMAMMVKMGRKLPVPLKEDAWKLREAAYQMINALLKANSDFQ